MIYVSSLCLIPQISLMMCKNFVMPIQVLRRFSNWLEWSLPLSTFFFAENSKNFSSDSRRLWQVSCLSWPVVTFVATRVIIKLVVQTCSSHHRGQKVRTWITGLTDQILLVKTEIDGIEARAESTREGKFCPWEFISKYIIVKSVQSAF